MIAMIAASAPVSADKAVQQAIAEGVIEAVTVNDRIPGIKLSVTVRLSAKLPAERLEVIAADIKGNNLGYERIFIEYLLPGMEYGNGAWATTHFDPTMKVKILGITFEKERELSVVPVVDGREIIGAWIHEWWFTGGRIVFFRKDDRVFVEITYQDGSAKIDEYRPKPEIGGGTRYDPVEYNDFGEHFLLLESGELQYRDREGSLGTAKRLQ